MPTVTKPTNHENGEAAERAVRKRLGEYIPPCKCPQHGNSMRARSSRATATYYYCKYCSYSKLVSRPPLPPEIVT